SAAVTTDGTVFTWGVNISDLYSVPPDLTNAVAISGSGFHYLALRSDGTVRGWGSDVWGEATVPVGLGNAVAVAAGPYHSLALTDEGTVLGWGLNTAGQTEVPEHLTDVVAISAGQSSSLALKSDGTVAAWGNGLSGESDVPAWLTNVVAISSGIAHHLALVGDGRPFITRQPYHQTVEVGGEVILRLVAMGRRPMRFSWQRNGVDISGATNDALVLTNVLEKASYQCRVSNVLGTNSSLPAIVSVQRTSPRFVTSSV